jgi:hypothetical protein
MGPATQPSSGGPPHRPCAPRAFLTPYPKSKPRPSKDDTRFEPKTAHHGAEGKFSDPFKFGAIFTTSAVGGGLNFHITRVVFAVISRKLANAQEAFQTYLRSRNVEHIYVATYGAGPWDGRFYDGFKAVTPSGS